ncbi:MAG: hypothetical protein PVH54_12415 [Gammaproteobacteria bacterium]
MMKSRFTKRRYDPLMLLGLLVTLGVVMASTTSAAEPFLSKPNLGDLQDGDITLARAQHGGAGIHMSFTSPPILCGDCETGQVVTSDALTLPDVYLSLRLHW